MLESLKQLVKFRTISADPDEKEFRKAANYIKNLLTSVNLEVEILENKLPTVYAYKDFGREKTVCFITHYDVVPPGDGWKFNPFEPVEDDGKIFGRGASDAKAGIVAFVEALRELINANAKPAFNVKFFSFPDEEMGGALGIRWVINSHRELLENADVFYILDCSTEGVEIGASGVIGGRIVIKGRGGHAAFPFKCVNAVEKGVELCEKLMEFAKEESKRISKCLAPENPVNKNVWNRFSVTVFRGGVKSNVIPGYAEIRFNWRLIPEDDIARRKKEFEGLFEKWKEELKIDAELKFIMEHSGYAISEDNEFVKKLKNAVEKVKKNAATCFVDLAATDGNVIYSAFKKPVIGFGPIDPDANIHGPNEFVRITTLEEVKEVVKNFLQSE
jgi:succinyl-diaminopimelate desuccinylase